MSRLLYISGMVFFAVLIGDAGARLWDLYEAGTLFDQYTSERRSALTLLTVASCGLGALCIIELVRVRRRHAHAAGPIPPGFFDEEPVAGEQASTSIYAAPDEIDAWQYRQGGSTMVMSSRRGLPFMQSLNLTGMWMSILRIYCGVLPVVYTYTLLNYLFYWLPSGAGNIALTVLFPLLVLGSVLTSIGILRTKRWGMYMGYVMAVFHLLIFPFGTAAGFVMLIALMSASSAFSQPRRRIRHRA